MRIAPCAINDLLSSHGPEFVVLGLLPELHAIVVTGIHGDKTDTGTFVTFIDPLLPNDNVCELPYGVFITAVQPAINTQWAQQA